MAQTQRKTAMLSPEDRLLAAIFGEGAPALEVGEVDRLVASGFTADEVFAAVVPRRTFFRRRAKDEPLSDDEAERVARLARVRDLAERVMGDAAAGFGWLRTPNRALTGQPPMALLRSEAGARLVEDVLNRIDHGIVE